VNNITFGPYPEGEIAVLQQKRSWTMQKEETQDQPADQKEGDIHLRKPDCDPLLTADGLIDGGEYNPNPTRIWDFDDQGGPNTIAGH